MPRDRRRRHRARSRPSAGWKFAGGAGCAIGIDAANPHSGQGSLKLTAPVVPASVTSGDFVPSSASSMMIQAYLRSEPAGPSGAAVDRGRGWRAALPPPHRVCHPRSLGAEGRAGHRPARRRTRLGTAAVRADQPGNALDRRSSRGRRDHPQGRAAQCSADAAGGPAGLSRPALRRVRTPVQLALGATSQHPGRSRPNRPAELSETASPGRPGPAAASALSPERRLR